MIIIKRAFITNTFIAILMELNIGECVLVKKYEETSYGTNSR